MNKFLSEIFMRDFIDYLEKQFPVYCSIKDKTYGTYVNALGANVCGQALLVAIPSFEENAIIITRASDATHKMVLQLNDGFNGKEKGVYVYHFVNGELFKPESKSENPTPNPVRYPFSTNPVDVAQVAQRTMTGDAALKFKDYLLDPTLKAIDKTIIFFSNTESFKNMEKNDPERYLRTCRNLERISQWLEGWNKSDVISYVLQDYYAKMANISIAPKSPPKFKNKTEELDYSTAMLGNAIKNLA